MPKKARDLWERYSLLNRAPSLNYHLGKSINRRGLPSLQGKVAVVVDSGFMALNASLLAPNLNDYKIIIENFCYPADSKAFFHAMHLLLRVMVGRESEIAFVDTTGQSIRSLLSGVDIIFGPVSSKIMRVTPPWKKSYFDHGLSDTLPPQIYSIARVIIVRSFLRVIGKYSSGVSFFENLSVFRSRSGYLESVFDALRDNEVLRSRIREHLKSEFVNFKSVTVMLAFSPWESHEKAWKYCEADIIEANLKLLVTYAKKDCMTVIKFHPSMARKGITGQILIERARSEGYSVVLFEDLFDFQGGRYWPVELAALAFDVDRAFGDFSSACVTLTWLGVDSVHTPLSWYEKTLTAFELAIVDKARGFARKNCLFFD